MDVKFPLLHYQRGVAVLPRFGEIGGKAAFGVPIRVQLPASARACYFAIRDSRCIRCWRSHRASQRRFLSLTAVATQGRPDRATITPSKAVIFLVPAEKGFFVQATAESSMNVTSSKHAGIVNSNTRSIIMQQRRMFSPTFLY